MKLNSIKHSSSMCGAPGLISSINGTTGIYLWAHVLPIPELLLTLDREDN